MRPTIHLCVSLALLITLLLCTPAGAAVTHVWSAAFGDTPAGEYGISVSTDPSGNLFLAGAFRGTVDFGGGPLTAGGSLGWGDAFLAKFDATGNHLWSRRFGGPRQDAAIAGVAGPRGNAVIVQRLWGLFDYGGGPVGIDRMNSVAVAKFDPDGNHVWSESFGEEDPGEGIYTYAATVDGTGSTYLTGEFNGTVYLGGDSLRSVDGAMFLARYDRDGRHLWGVPAETGDGYTGGFWGIDVARGNVFVTSLAGSGFDLSKYDTTGAHVWTRSFRPTGISNHAATAADGSGNVFVTGVFSGAIDFGGGLLISGGMSGFVVKFDADGGYVWGRVWDGAQSESYGRSACVDPSGSVIVAGVMQGDVDFGGGLLTGAGGLDVFLAEFGADGSHAWSRLFGGSENEMPLDVYLDKRGRVYLTGVFQGSADFGGAPLVSAGGDDIFVARYDIVMINFFDAHAAPDVVHLYSSFDAELGVDTVCVYRGEASDSLSLYRRVPQSGAAFHFQDRHFTPGQTYRYRIGVTTIYGESFSPVRTVSTQRYTTALFPSAPNPFNPFTTIRYELAQGGPVSLLIYDVRGRRVATLVDDVQGAGPHSVRWNATNADGAEVGSGVYFCRLETAGAVFSTRMVLVK